MSKIFSQKFTASLALCVCASTVANDYTSHTTFVPRPLFHDVAAEKIALFNQTPLNQNCYGSLGAGFQAVVFASTSVNTAEIARFFLPFGKTQIVAGEDKSQAVDDNTVDVLAKYFGVKTSDIDANQTFQSTVQFKPKQNVQGLGLNYVQDFSKYGFKGIRLNIQTPILRVHNNLHAKESITNEGGGDVPAGYVGSMMEAFTGDTVFGDKHFRYGKIAPCGLTKWGLGDIEISIGSQNHELCVCQRGWWLGAVIPTGNKPKGEYLFEPIVGNNHHFGVIFGGYYHHQVWTNHDDKEIWVHFHSQTRHLFPNKQRRSFDLVDKQWSRYIWLFPSKTSSPTDVNPGINFLTLPVDVAPRSVLNINTAATYSCEGLLLEGGMNTFARQSEKVKLKCAYNGDAAIVGETDEEAPVSRSNATIRHFAGIDNDTKYTPFKESDINLASAAQPATLSYVFYASAGYQWLEIDYPSFISLGGSYEYSADNAGLERWMGWIKGGMAF